MTNILVLTQEIMFEIPISKIEIDSVLLDILRLDLAHADIHGNKWYKLRLNIEAAKTADLNSILTFGGAFSNHIHAVSIAGKKYGLRTIGIIRGEDDLNNPTLNLARENEMELHFVSRNEYSRKSDPAFQHQLKKKFGDFYFIPEGGSNYLGIAGCKEILKGLEKNYDRIFCAVGTGGTLAGLISTPGLMSMVEGVVVLKGGITIEKFIESNLPDEHVPWKLHFEYHLGGYAKFNMHLIEFIRQFQDEFSIKLDPVYTGKLMFAIREMIRTGEIKKGQKILAVHTGGLQGIAGWEYRFGRIFSE